MLVGHHHLITISERHESGPALFDAHLHIIDPAFPLIANQGYTPEAFTAADYAAATAGLEVVGGAVVSGSFQAFDQSYLLAALARLGPAFVGVSQLPATVTDEELLTLDAAGVRAVRFNAARGGSEDLAHLDALARRVAEVASWHVELYIDAAHLPDLAPTLKALPQVSIDHLGLTRAGLAHLLDLAGAGAKVKATGFARTDLDVPAALRAIAAANPGALMVGTDLPSTRAPRPFTPADLDVVLDALGPEDAIAAFSANAGALYRPRQLVIG